MKLAAEQQRVMVTGDTDFGALLSLLRIRSQSVIPDHLNDLAEDLDAGAVVVMTDDSIRVRRLPLLHDT